MALIRGEEVDQKFGWPIGRANKLARKGKLPYVLLPDASIRFEWDAISLLIRRVCPTEVADPTIEVGNA